MQRHLANGGDAILGGSDHEVRTQQEANVFRLIWSQIGVIWFDFEVFVHISQLVSCFLAFKNGGQSMWVLLLHSGGSTFPRNFRK